MAKYAFPRAPEFVCGPCGAQFCRDEAPKIGLEKFGPGNGDSIVCPNCLEKYGVHSASWKMFTVEGLDNFTVRDHDG